MRKHLLSIAATIASSFFIFILTARATILISKIQTSGGSVTDEYVELYNPASTTVSLGGWSLKKQTASGTKSNLVSSFPSLIINPFSYLLVAHPNYRPINGVTADVIYSTVSNSLADNNSIELLDADNNIIDEVFWGAVSTTAGSPALNPPAAESLVRLPDDESGNWQDTNNSNADFILLSSSPFNAASPSRPFFISTTVTSTDTSTTIQPAENASPDASLFNLVKLNEFVPNPESGNEWIELYNTTSTSINLTGVELCDGRTSGSCTIATPTSTIGPLDWLVVQLNSSKLNNDGDSILLKDASGTILDAISYGTVNLAAPTKGESLARKNDGADSDSDNDWSITTSLTPGAKNVITIPPSPPSTSNSSGSNSVTNNPCTNCTPTTNDIAAVRYATSTSPLILNELYPNPPGADLTDEFIEITNRSANTVDLTGWKLADSQKSFSLSGSIMPQELLVWPRTVSGISLNNSTKETVRLLDHSGAIADEVTYDNAPSGASFSRDDSGAWQWTEEVTKGLPNVIDQSDTVGIAWKIDAPRFGIPHVPLVFDAHESADPRGGLLTIGWTMDDGTSLVGDYVTHAFATSGVYTVRINATSTQGTIGNKTVRVTIGEGAAFVSGDVILNEILVNPPGEDNGEFIELYNRSATPVNLAGWQLKTKSGKLFTIPLKTIIAATSYLAFFRPATHLALANTSDVVSLVSPYGETIDVVKVNHGIAGESYALFGEEWHWTSASTPAAANVLDGQVLGEKIINSATTKTVGRASTKKYSPIVAMSLADAREADKGSHVRVSGVVTVPPGIFGKRYGYIGDGTNGLQIYFTKANFPSLHGGENVTLTGTMSAAYGTPRLNVKLASDVGIQKSSGELLPLDSELEDLDESGLGNLVRIQGEVTDVKSNYIYLDDGQNEMQVYLKKGTGIAKTLFHPGDHIAVTGIVEQSHGAWQVWPRSTKDIAAVENDKVEVGTATDSPVRLSYTTITIGGSVLLALAFVLKYRGAELWRRLKK